MWGSLLGLRSWQTAFSGASPSGPNRKRARKTRKTGKGPRKLLTFTPFWARSLVAATLSIMSAGHSSAAETSIKLGNTAPYSGPASAYGTIARAEAAYFQMLNDEGGVNGRKIEFLTLDDAYSPAKTVEQTRKLVEDDEVFAMVGSLGTPTNSAVQRYLNSKKVPQALISTGASKWNDPKQFPYTVGLAPPYQLEGET